MLNKTFSVRYISFIRIAHSYLSYGAVIRPKHACDCSRRQARPYLFLAAGRPRRSAFSQEIPESNYPTSATLVVVSRSLRQRFACRRTQLSSLEVVSRDVDLTSKLIYDVVMHTAPKILDRDYKIERSTEHRAKFCANRPTELGDYAAKKRN